MSAPVQHKNYIQRLYRQALRTVFDHYAWERPIYRQHCIQVRQRFEANRHETNPLRVEALVRKTELELEEMAHPRPYKHPTAPGGVKHYRNQPLPLWLVNHGEGNWVCDSVEYEPIK